MCVFALEKLGHPGILFQCFLFCVELRCVIHTFILFHQWDVTWQLQINVFDIPQTLAYMIKPKDTKDYMWILNSALWIQKWVSLPPCEYTSINCHEPGAELQNQSLETRENHINSNFDFHDTACLFLLGVGYGRNKNTIR